MPEETITVNLNPHSFLTEPVEIVTAVSEPIPPGTKAPPRPPGKERTASSPETGAQLGALIATIEASLQVIHGALAEIKQLHQLPPQSKPQSKAG